MALPSDVHSRLDSPSKFSIPEPSLGLPSHVWLGCRVRRELEGWDALLDVKSRQQLSIRQLSFDYQLAAHYQLGHPTVRPASAQVQVTVVRGGAAVGHAVAYEVLETRMSQVGWQVRFNSFERASFLILSDPQLPVAVQGCVA
jgi:hypothetical protein